MTAAALFFKEINKLDLYEIERSAMHIDDEDLDDVRGGYGSPADTYSEEALHTRGRRAAHRWYRENQY